MLTLIKSRRSVRQWKADAVPEEDIEKILDAAMNAPSAGNEQPWQFIVVTDQEVLKKAAVLNPYGGFVKDAPVAILVCGDVRLEKFPGYWVQDCSAAVENMLLTAHSLGLGAVWTSVYPIDDRMVGFSKLFSLPEEVIPFALVPIGYPRAKLREAVSRFNLSRIRKNSW